MGPEKLSELILPVLLRGSAVCPAWAQGDQCIVMEALSAALAGKWSFPGTLSLTGGEQVSSRAVFPSGGAMASFSSSRSEVIGTRGAFSRWAGQGAGEWGSGGGRVGVHPAA